MHPVGCARVGRWNAGTVLAALLVLVVAASLLLSAGGQSSISPAQAASGTALGAALAQVRVSPDGSRLSGALEVKNPGGAFSGWIEVDGLQRTVLVPVEVGEGASRIPFTAYPTDSRPTLRVRLLDSAERPVSAFSQRTFDNVFTLVVGEDGPAFRDSIVQFEHSGVEQNLAFPDDLTELDLYSRVVVAAPSEPEMERAWEALLDWVRRGGVLVIAGPSSLPASTLGGGFQGSFGTPEAVAPGKGTLALADGWNAPLATGVALPDGSVIASVDLPGADIVVSDQEGTVVAALRRFGQGTVVLTGISPARIGGGSVPVKDPGTEVMGWFWSFVGYSSYPGGFFSPDWTDPAHLFLTGRVPGVALTVAFAVAYVAILGVGVFALLRRARRLDTAWWAIPVLVLVTTAAVLGSVLVSRGTEPQVLARRTVSTDYETGATREEMSVGLYSPFGTKFSLEVDQWGVPGPLRTYGISLERPYVLRLAAPSGGGLRFEEVAVLPGSGRSVSVRWPEVDPTASAPAPVRQPLAATKTEQADTILWTVTNRGDDTLRRVLLVGEGVYALPDLPPGGSVSFGVGGGGITGEGVEVVSERPERSRSRDQLEWEAENRLRTEWDFGGTWSAVDESGVGYESSVPVAPGSETRISTKEVPVQVRVLAWAQDPDALGRFTGLPEGIAVSGVVAYELMLR